VVFGVCCPGFVVLWVYFVGWLGLLVGCWLLGGVWCFWGGFVGFCVLLAVVLGLFWVVLGMAGVFFLCEFLGSVGYGCWLVFVV
jgi:hypothetical protein